MSDQFKDLARVLRERRLVSKSRANILKHHQIRPADRVRNIAHPALESPRLAPIHDDDGEIVGVTVHCTCGQEIHVYFEYPPEDPPTAA